MIDRDIVDKLGNVWAKSPPNTKITGESLLKHSMAVVWETGEFIKLYSREIDAVKDFDLKRVLLYAAFVHDFGKIHLRFQEQLRSGYPSGLRHEVLSLAFLEYVCVPENEIGWLAAAVVLHHKDWRFLIEGSNRLPPYFHWAVAVEDIAPLIELTSNLPIEQIQSLYLILKEAEIIIKDVTEISIIPYEVTAFSTNVNMARAIYKHLQYIEKLVKELKPKVSRGRSSSFNKKLVYTGVLARGLLMSADHLASAGEKKLEKGFTDVEMLCKKLGREFFDLWPHQQEMSKVSGNAVLIAPTGSGKTETALIWAARQRNITHSYGRIFFLLPYRASMNAMADRLAKDFGSNAVALVHGKSLIRLYEKLLEQEDTPNLAYIKARRAEDLARLNVAFLRICSPYQLIKSFFGQKGYEAIICSALGAQLIFDEIHAYDTKIAAMSLVTAKFLCDRFGAKVLFMSATLPSHLLSILTELFPNLPNPILPPINWLEQQQRHKLNIVNYHSLSEASVQAIKEAASTGSVLVVVNKVKRAIELAERLSNVIDDVILLHSRFNVRDRNIKERELTSQCGRVLVATQVVEVSLDIDYDTGFFELAPLEAILQRCGRVNRHGFKRKPASVNIYAVFDDSDKKQALPYESIHLQQVLRVLNKFIKSSKNGIWDEGNTQKLLDESYPEEIKARLVENLNFAANEFAKCFADQLCPFGIQDSSRLKELREQWDKLFDGIEVLPECLLSEAEKSESLLEIAKLLVPISSFNFYKLKLDNKLYWHDGIQEYVTKCGYDLKIGLKL